MGLKERKMEMNFSDLINVYCDESCHLEKDMQSHMVLGCTYCPNSKAKEINKRITEIKNKHGVKSTSEIKWTKISNTKIDLYEDIINYFFDNECLKFRCVVAPKEYLDHESFNQTHDDWYYKMYFHTISFIMNPQNRYNIFIDIKDTNSPKKIDKLKEVLSNNMYDFSHARYIKSMQPIHSHEVQIMQITDILIGAMSYHHRKLNSSETKVKLINQIQNRSGYSLLKNTPVAESKFNILVWSPRNV